MSERDDFLGWVGSRLRDAEIALHNGDAAPRAAIWSNKDPVTVLGAWVSGSGHQEVSDIFCQLERAFSDFSSYSHEIIAADVTGDMAYTVGYEHTRACVNGEPRQYSCDEGLSPRGWRGEGRAPPRGHTDAVRIRTGIPRAHTSARRPVRTGRRMLKPHWGDGPLSEPSPSLHS
jgi:hypothetical protein